MHALLSPLSQVASWCRHLHQSPQQKRADLLQTRLQEYCEEGHRRAGHRFSLCREQVIYEFQERGYTVSEILTALHRLTQAGILTHSCGWYFLAPE